METTNLREYVAPEEGEIIIEDDEIKIETPESELNTTNNVTVASLITNQKMTQNLYDKIYSKLELTQSVSVVFHACGICTKIYATAEELGEHLKTIHPPITTRILKNSGLYFCDTCQLLHPERMKTEHWPCNAVDIQCFFCLINMPLKSHFADHGLTWHNFRKFQCNYCTINTKELSFTELNAHLKMHNSNQGVYKCTRCNVFYSKYILDRHVEIYHNGCKCTERVCCCHKFDRSFYKKKLLKIQDIEKTLRPPSNNIWCSTDSKGNRQIEDISFYSPPVSPEPDSDPLEIKFLNENDSHKQTENSKDLEIEANTSTSTSKKYEMIKSNIYLRDINELRENTSKETDKDNIFNDLLSRDEVESSINIIQNSKQRKQTCLLPYRTYFNGSKVLKNNKLNESPKRLAKICIKNSISNNKHTTNEVENSTENIFQNDDPNSTSTPKNIPKKTNIFFCDSPKSPEIESDPLEMNFSNENSFHEPIENSIDLQVEANTSENISEKQPKSKIYVRDINELRGNIIKKSSKNSVFNNIISKVDNLANFSRPRTQQRKIPFAKPNLNYSKRKVQENIKKVVARQRENKISLKTNNKKREILGKDDNINSISNNKPTIGEVENTIEVSQNIVTRQHKKKFSIKSNNKNPEILAKQDNVTLITKVGSIIDEIENSARLRTLCTKPILTYSRRKDPEIIKNIKEVENSMSNNKHADNIENSTEVVQNVEQDSTQIKPNFAYEKRLKLIEDNELEKNSEQNNKLEDIEKKPDETDILSLTQPKNIEKIKKPKLSYSEIKDLLFSKFCVVCKIKFSHPTLLNTHCIRMHRPWALEILNDVYCTFCETWFSLEQYGFHYPCARDSVRHSCPLCLMRYPLKEHFDLHRIIYNHFNRVLCTICENNPIEYSIFELNKHRINEHRLNGAFECLKCKVKFNTVHNLKRHFVSQNHKNDNINSASVYKLKLTSEYNFSDYKKCTVCKKTYFSKAKIKRHRCKVPLDVSLQTKKSYNCTKCSGTFKAQRYLIQHMDIHTENKRYWCILCSMTFTQQTSLLYHMSTHTKENVFKCSVCNIKYDAQKKLTMHMEIHNSDGTNPNRCNKCGKFFSHNCKLLVHMRLHTKIGENKES